MIDEASRRDIERRADRLLKQADAVGRFPTPIGDLLAAQELARAAPEESPLGLASLLSAPLGLQRRLRRVLTKVKAVLDKRARIVHVRPEKLEVQERFNECHEIGHDLCQWHLEPYYLDGREELDPEVAATFEQEANYAGAELLFQGDLYGTMARSSTFGMASVVDLGERFGASIHASFRQYVARMDGAVAGVVLNKPFWRSSGDLAFPIRQFLASEEFCNDFSFLETPQRQLSSADYPGLEEAFQQVSRTGFVGSSSIALPLRSGVTLEIPVELFSNTYHFFLLLRPEHRALFKRRVSFGFAANN